MLHVEHRDIQLQIHSHWQGDEFKRKRGRSGEFYEAKRTVVYVAPPFIADGVLVAEGSVTIGEGSTVSSGVCS